MGASTKKRIEKLNKDREKIHKEQSPMKSQPVDLVKWVPIEKVRANDYNPNRVAKTELALLYTSIKHDGYTQPIVTAYDKDRDEYVIIDGFHRYYVSKKNKDLLEKNYGCVPVTVLDKGANDRMASTVRHNRARGKHSVSGMANMVFKMLDNGWGDTDICNELGMDAEELLRLKHITGYSKLFENMEYRRAWEAKNQILVRKKYQEGQKKTEE